MLLESLYFSMTGIMYLCLDDTHNCPVWRCVDEKPETGSRERQACRLEKVSMNVVAEVLNSFSVCHGVEIFLLESLTAHKSRYVLLDLQ